jgi:hypothetical protein
LGDGERPPAAYEYLRRRGRKLARRDDGGPHGRAHQRKREVLEARMNSVAQTRPTGGERGLAPYPLQIQGVRRRTRTLTAYGWAAICTLVALTLFATALLVH